MQKILIVSSKNLLSQPFEGAQKRILDISKFLSKKNQIDLVCIGDNILKKKNDLKHFNHFKTFRINFTSKIINMIFAFLKLEPVQNGYFFSKEMSNYIDENKDNYDTIIFHLVRSAQYLPKEYRGKTILEMTDLMSANYDQIIKNISVLNPIKYLYFFENILVKNYEKKISNFFDKVVFISKKELKTSKTLIDKNKIAVVGNQFKIQSKTFKYKKNNYKILFVGNVNYFPNKLACYNFAKKIMPKLNEKYEIIAVSKSDALDEKNANKQKEKLSLATNAQVFLLSSISGNGVREILRTINESLNRNQNNSEPRELVDPSGTTASIGKHHE